MFDHFVSLVIAALIFVIINIKYVFTGFSSDGVQDATKNQAWGVILVVGIIVGLIALTGFLILNRRNKRDFSHRKLVEDISPDPGNTKLSFVIIFGSICVDI